MYFDLKDKIKLSATVTNDREASMARIIGGPTERMDVMHQE